MIRVVILILLLSACGTYCDYLNKVKKELIVGKVTKKESIDWNKGERIIYFENDSSSLFTISLTATDKSGLFENVSVNDSILKERNTLQVKVKKGDGTVKVFDIGKKGCY